jgi:alginate O-acetyltransferase complex protein AlgI
VLFNTPQFFVFLLVTLVLFYTAPASWRKPLLLAASYWFYMSWNWRFAPLLLTLTAIDYLAGRWIENAGGARRRKLLLIVSLAANLGFLGVFKYYNFLASQTALLLGRPENAFGLSIVLPLGISFHTFQSISYVVDVYRGRQAAVRNVLDYALFIAFFPQLVAGPIVRAHEFFGDLYRWRPPNGEELNRGALLVLFGLTKKMALADPFALMADRYFGGLAAHPGVLAAWSGVLAFAVQIYFDFSGYTDMAIGMALLLGFHFPVNFRRPYLAAGITEFWHRWHMSLSLWLRDYLYITLGGNRKGRLRTYVNLMATMLLGGLWHGANWKFVVWGGYHGALLGIERAAGRGFPRVMTFGLVTIGWVFFRAASLRESVTIIGRMFAGPRGVWLWERWQLDLMLGVLVLTILEEKLEWFERLVKAPAWVYGAATALLLLSLELIGVTEVSVPFVYFQF